VVWADSFWNSNQEWLLYDVAGTTTGFTSNVTLNTTNWQDSTGALFLTARPNASFGVQQRGSDVFVVYAIVPEPAGLALAGIGATLAAWMAWRRQSSRNVLTS
jgi:hypothetical protein